MENYLSALSALATNINFTGKFVLLEGPNHNTWNDRYFLKTFLMQTKGRRKG